jgi:phage terminase large subunit-like protein
MAQRDVASQLDALAEIVWSMSNDELVIFMGSIDGDDLSLVEGIIGERQSIGWRADPAAMAAHFDQTYQRWRYIRYLAAKFVQLVTGEDPNQIWNLASRYGKSLLLRWGTVWTFDRHPDANMIFTSYADDLANENAIFVRDTLAAHPDELRTQLRLDRRRMDRFVTTHGGGLLAAGIHSGITGFGAGKHGGVILDDPYKGWVEAHNGLVRGDVIERYRSVLQLRRDDPTAWMLITHARMHEADISGELAKASEDLTQSPWTVVSLPSLAVEDDLLGRSPGEPLEPEKFDVAQVRERMQIAGPYLSSALEQQDPAPDEGRELKRDWFRLGTVPPNFDVAVSSWDMKLKDKEAGDFTVGQIHGRVGPDHWLVDGLRGQWSQAYTRVAMALLKVRHPYVNTHLVEFAGYGPEVITQIRNPAPTYELDDETCGELGITEDERPKVLNVIRSGLAGIIPITPKGSKSARARGVSGIAAGQNMHVNDRWPGAHDFVHEVIAFPTGQYDDQVDAWSQATAYIAGMFEANVVAAIDIRREIRPARSAPASRRRVAR